MRIVLESLIFIAARGLRGFTLADFLFFHRLIRSHRLIIGAEEVIGRIYGFSGLLEKFASFIY